MTPRRDPAEPDESDDEVEIVVDMPQREPKANPSLSAGPAVPASSTWRQPRHLPYLRPFPCPRRHRLPLQTSTRWRPPTNDPSSARPHRDRSTSMRAEPPTNVVHPSFRWQQDATNAASSNPAGFSVRGQLAHTISSQILDAAAPLAELNLKTTSNECWPRCSPRVQ